jgi:AhpD family alkylhydroperoxidase
MHRYPVHTVESAPEKSRNALTVIRDHMGFLPNLAAVMAHSPTLITGLAGALANFNNGSFSPGQRQTLLLTNAVTNRCAWAVAFHSTLALRAGVEPDDVAAIRERRLPRDPKLAALSQLTRALIEHRGHLDDRTVTAFTEAGFTADQVFEVIAGLAISTMTNYAGNIATPPVEPGIQAQAWVAPPG